MKPNYRIEEKSRNVHFVRMDDVGAGWEQYFLLRSDVHHDHAKCDWALEKKHLDQAKERGAGIVDNGDLFDCMGGKFDKRSDKSALREDYKHGDYLDALIREAKSFYKPYAENFVVLGKGNHETAIRNRHETDLTERLAQGLSTDNCKVHCGGYGNWIKFMFTIGGSQRTSRTLYTFHGTGGGGPVTRGTIQTNRIAVFTPDADIVLTGHTHDEWTMTIPRQRISDCGNLYHDEQLHVRCPGYKDAWGDGAAGWDVEKMLGPKSLGSAWLRFWLENKEIRCEVTRAK